MKIELKYAGVLSTISIDVSENEIDFQATKMVEIKNYKTAGLKILQGKSKKQLLVVLCQKYIALEKKPNFKITK
jgi:hypothetical protein